MLQILRVYLSKNLTLAAPNWKWLGALQGWEHSKGRSPGKDSHGENVEAKKGNLIGYGLKQS